jgi:hypothetical protein
MSSQSIMFYVLFWSIFKYLEGLKFEILQPWCRNMNHFRVNLHHLEGTNSTIFINHGKETSNDLELIYTLWKECISIFGSRVWSFTCLKIWNLEAQELFTEFNKLAVLKFCDVQTRHVS